MGQSGVASAATVSPTVSEPPPPPPAKEPEPAPVVVQEPKTSFHFTPFKPDDLPDPEVSEAPQNYFETIFPVAEVPSFTHTDNRHPEDEPPHNQESFPASGSYGFIHAIIPCSCNI